MSVKMSKLDLMDWIVGHGCETILLPEYKANVIFFRNPKTGGEAYLDLPLSDNPVRDGMVYRACFLLGIPIPTHATYLKGLNDDIENGDID